MRYTYEQYGKFMHDFIIAYTDHDEQDFYSLADILTIFTREHCDGMVENEGAFKFYMKDMLDVCNQHDIDMNGIEIDI